MTIDRELWKKWAPKDNFPIWICSKCNKGIFEIVKDTFHSVYDGSTETSKTHDAFDSDWVALRFCAILRCNNKSCQESAAVTGRGVVEQEHEYNMHGQPESTYVEYFKPEYCSPPPAVFKIPEKTPEEVSAEILHSFSIFLSQPNSAGNKIRTSIEKLLNSHRVKKTTISKKTKKRVKLTLHDRIIEYGKKNDTLSKNILAIKWIGNSASHTQGLEIEDIFDAYDLLHHVLNEIYDNRAKHIAKITKARNKRKK